MRYYGDFPADHRPDGSRPHDPVPFIVDLASATQDNADTELLAGLRSRPRFLPTRLGYDDKGSRLYAQIMRVPSYYLVRAEWELLSQYATAILDAARATAIVDLGAGTAEKTELLLTSLAGRHSARFVPLDVNAEVLRIAASRILERLPTVRLTPLRADFHAGLAWIRDNMPDDQVLVTLLGSTYGNMLPAARTALAGAVRNAVESHCGTFLVCADLHKTNGLIEGAYSTHGIDAPLRKEWALNRLDHINRIWEADFDRETFEPETRYDMNTHSVVAVLRSKIRQTIRFKRLGFELTVDQGEEIIRDIMHKFTSKEIIAEITSAGWALTGQWHNNIHGYGAFLFRAC
jgi:L-histidine Nalpha-methyltransferase